jgi:hypothetical protein
LEKLLYNTFICSALLNCSLHVALNRFLKDLHNLGIVVGDDLIVNLMSPLFSYAIICYVSQKNYNTQHKHGMEDIDMFVLFPILCLPPYRVLECAVDARIS